MDQFRADGEMGTNDNISLSPPTSPPTENGTSTPPKRFGPKKRGRDNDTPAFAPATPTVKISWLVDHYSSAAKRFAIIQDAQGIPELPRLHQSIANIVDSIRRRNTSLRLNELSVFDKAITHLYRDQDDKVAALLLFVAEYSGIINGANPFEKCDTAAQKLVQGRAIKEKPEITSGGAPSNGPAVSAAPATPYTSKGNMGGRPAQQPGTAVFSAQNGFGMAGTVAPKQPAFPAGVGATQAASAQAASAQVASAQVESAQIASSETHGLPAQSLSANFLPPASHMPDPMFAAASNGNSGGSENANIDPRLLNPQSTYLSVHGLFDGDDGSWVPQEWNANGNVGSGAQ